MKSNSNKVTRMTYEDKVKYLEELKKRYPILLKLRDRFELKVIDIQDHEIPTATK